MFYKVFLIPESPFMPDIDEANWRDIPRVMPSGWFGVNRSLCDAGSYQYAVDDAAEVQSVHYSLCGRPLIVDGKSSEIR